MKPKEGEERHSTVEHKRQYFHVIGKEKVCVQKGDGRRYIVRRSAA